MKNSAESTSIQNLGKKMMRIAKHILQSVLVIFYSFCYQILFDDIDNLIEYRATNFIIPNKIIYLKKYFDVTSYFYKQNLGI